MAGDGRFAGGGRGYGWVWERNGRGPGVGRGNCIFSSVLMVILHKGRIVISKNSFFWVYRDPFGLHLEGAPVSRSPVLVSGLDLRVEKTIQSI